MSEHTTGPLRVSEAVSKKLDERGDCAIIDSAGKIVGEAFALVGPGETRPARANADLWAAAPDLLEALASLERQTRDHRFMPDHACAECVPNSEILVAGFQCGRHAARALLAKVPR